MDDVSQTTYPGEPSFQWRDEDWPELTLHQALDRALERFGADKVAYSYVDEGVDLTLEDVDDAAETWARALIGAGVGVGDRVAVFLPGRALWPVLQVAASRIGAIVVGLNTRYRTHELRHVLGSSTPKAIVTMEDWRGIAFMELIATVLDDLGGSGEALCPVRVTTAATAHAGFVRAVDFLPGGDAHAEEAARRRAAVRPRDIALIQYTSGSTATPKGTLLTHDGILRTAFHLLRAAGYGPDDVVYSALPFYHIGGSVCTGVGAVITGARMIVPETYEPLASVRQMIDFECTAVQGHAAMFTMQIDAAAAAGLLDRIDVRKGWLIGPPPVLRRAATAFGIEELIPAYGMSEYGTITVGDRAMPLEDRLSSIGRPVPGTEVRIVGEPGGIGEIQVRGRQTMLGYHDDEEATRAAFTDDGWLRTGDLGRWNDGYIEFAGREKDMIKPGGENVSAAEVEDFLMENPLISAVAVIAIPDRRLGEAPAAVVRPAPGVRLTEADVLDFCDGRIAKFKTPKVVHIEAELPLLASGKLDKRELRKRYGSG